MVVWSSWAESRDEDPNYALSNKRLRQLCWLAVRLNWMTFFDPESLSSGRPSHVK